MTTSKLVVFLVLILSGLSIAKIFKSTTAMVYRKGWREVLFITMSWVTVIVMMWFYYTGVSIPHIIRLGYIGSFMAGIGLFFLGFQYLSQASSAETSQNNENLQRIWNINNLVNDMLVKYNKYLTNIKLLKQFNDCKCGLEGKIGTEKCMEYQEYNRLEIENPELLKLINNDMDSLFTMYDSNYFDARLLISSYGIFVKMVTDFSNAEFDGKPFITSDYTRFLADIKKADGPA